MKTAFVDIDTQLDFMVPSGALYVRGAELVVPAIVRLNGCAAASGIPVISTTDAHTEADPEFETWPPHCVVGTLGQRKPAATLLDRRAAVSSTPGLPDIARAQQIVIEKQHLDCFTNPNLPAVLDALACDRYVVYGVVTEYCVQYATLGLLARGKRVELVTDAVRSLNEADSKKTLEDVVAAGGALTTVDAVLREFTAS